MAWDDPVYASDVHPGMPWDLMRLPWENARYVVVSEARQHELARLLGLAPDRIYVVPPGVDPAEFFGVTPATSGWIEQFGLLGAAPLLLLPARVTRRKNIALAIEIVAALRDAGMTPRLVVMGPLGPHNPKNKLYLQELRELQARLGLSAQVIFLQEHGQVDDATRRDLFALADAMLFPSEREGFGIPILEAGLARLPIFASAIPPFHESAAENAVFFELSVTPTEIAALVKDRLSADPRYRLKRRVLENYHWDRIVADRIVPLIRSIASNENAS
jgi:glycosyltransferase involved in cell wall biosynthesis